ncbi:ferredoxin reductase [Thermoleophilia bacterium SCSIO 60948]|nr:ferredoxin reductase [Thermoleophilia bacterium SCSIO 60948]
MAERGAKPDVHPVRAKALGAMRWLFTPLLPDDYVELINPLWSTRELRGRVERIDRETDDTVTIVIRPGHAWPGHKAGQYLRIGVIIDGVHHWRAYSLTSEPEDELISVTPKLVPDGQVSPHLVQQLKPGALIRLGGVEGDFVLPEPLPEKFLFISAGSGITPIMSMLRELDRRDRVDDVMLIHSSHTRDGIAFLEELESLEQKHGGCKLHLQITGEDSDQGRIEPSDLDDICPDWRDRATFASGPGDLLDALLEHWEEEPDANPELLFMERFQSRISGGEEGEGGEVTFTKSEVSGESDGSQPILVVGEEAGIEMPYGCREGICHTCLCKLVSGQVRDMRNGEVKGMEDEMIRTCIHAPEGPVEIEI